jgi:hypothetical protein
MTLGLREPMGKPGDVGYPVCLALYRFVSLLIMLPYSDDQESQQHGVYDTHDSVEEASDVVVLLALFVRYQALHRLQPSDCG